MLKETDIEQTVGFVDILFIIGGNSIGECAPRPLPPPPPPLGYAHDLWLPIRFLFLFKN